MSSREVYLQAYIWAKHRDRLQHYRDCSKLDPEEVERAQKALFGDWSWQIAMTCPNTPPETPGPKDEILETPLVVNVPTTSMTNSPKKKKVSLWSRFVNKVTPEINSLKRLDGKPHGPRAVEAAASESNKAKQAKKGKEEEVVDPRTDSANVVVVASGSKNSDVSSSIVVGEASSSRVSDTGCSVKETEASKESVEPREF